MTANAFDEEAEQIGLLFAAHAAMALRGEQLEGELRAALRNRDTIGMAKGILIERYRIAEHQAFDMLVRISQNRHIKLHDVAAYLVRSGDELQRRVGHQQFGGGSRAPLHTLGEGGRPTSDQAASN